jgi:hypothetical protein
MFARPALRQGPADLERLRRPAASLLAPALLLSAVVAILIALGGSAAVIAGFFALVLALDRALPNDDAAPAGAERIFRRLLWERRRAALPQRLQHRALAPNRLLHLSEDKGWAALAERRHLGVQAIALDSIVGTVERKKATAFDRRFRPPPWSRQRWTGLWLAAQRGTALPPISVYRVGDKHFVRDGHHRVSVASALATAAIEADIVELRPSALHSADNVPKAPASGAPASSGCHEAYRDGSEPSPDGPPRIPRQRSPSALADVH